ncbi:MAG: methyltransferase domain-containing protein [Desulfovibrio sp.]|nr:methyltransferase domain-containing protein [Desulfovibrio sp.]
MGYQTFPWARGSSQSSRKLIALQLPALKGKTFLDVGCNEGFFCGYAEFMGAKSVTGIDIEPRFLAMAETLFPGCTFLCQDWEDLGPERYDVILNASAIHYAKDQKKFLDMLMSRLNPGGTLVLEIGVAPGTANEFVEVTRSIDTRFFPTRAKLGEMLDGYAFKLISQSVPQAGDPIPREVYHISHKLPYAILALDDPFAGKSFTVREIFKPEIRRISGDVLYYAVADGSRTAPPAITDIVMQNKARMDCGSITYQIFKKGLFADFCQWLAETGGHKDFILDMYIPAPGRRALAKSLEEHGYYVVNIQLQKAVSRPRAREMAPRGSCARYMEHLQQEFMIDEEAYLAANPDVAEALRAGRIRSAFEHYIFHGRREGRKRAPDDKNEGREARNPEPPAAD